MDYRFLVQKNLREWEETLMTGDVGNCHFCTVFGDDECMECPMLVSPRKTCCTMILNGRAWDEGNEHLTYIRGCISFYTEWLRTGIMPTVEYR